MINQKAVNQTECQIQMFCHLKSAEILKFDRFSIEISKWAKYSESNITYSLVLVSQFVVRVIVFLWLLLLQLLLLLWLFSWWLVIIFNAKGIVIFALGRLSHHAASIFIWWWRQTGYRWICAIGYIVVVMWIVIFRYGSLWI